MDGRDATISGTATSKAAIDDAVAKVATVYGVRSVTSAVALAEFASPFPFTASIKGGAATLGGAYPDESIHAALVTQAGKASDSMRLASGAPSSYEAGAKFALTALADLDDGQVNLSDTTLTISGRAKSTEAFDSLQALPKAVPAGIQLAALKISPPLVSPYVWSAKFDGTKVTITGDTPNS